MWFCWYEQRLEWQAADLAKAPGGHPDRDKNRSKIWVKSRQGVLPVSYLIYWGY
jgi:hypothetical protein